MKESYIKEVARFAKSIQNQETFCPSSELNEALNKLLDKRSHSYKDMNPEEFANQIAKDLVKVKQ